MKRTYLLFPCLLMSLVAAYGCQNDTVVSTVTGSAAADDSVAEVAQVSEMEASLYGTWIADVDFEIDLNQLPINERDRIIEMLSSSRVTVHFDESGDMVLASEILGERTEQFGTWRVLDVREDGLHIEQVSFAAGTPAEDVEITFLERDVIEVAQATQTLTFYREGTSAPVEPAK